MSTERLNTSLVHPETTLASVVALGIKAGETFFETKDIDFGTIDISTLRWTTNSSKCVAVR